MRDIAGKESYQANIPKLLARQLTWVKRSRSPEYNRAHSARSTGRDTAAQQLKISSWGKETLLFNWEGTDVRARGEKEGENYEAKRV